MLSSSDSDFGWRKLGVLADPARLRRAASKLKTPTIGNRRDRKPDPLGRTSLEIREMETEARVSWELGAHTRALSLYRVLACTTYPDGRRWLTYARREMESGNGHTAAFALQACLDLDPTNLDAIELLEESVFHLDLKGVSIGARLEALLEAGGVQKNSGLDLYDFFGARQFEPGLAALGTSDDPAVARLIEFHRLPGERVQEMIESASELSPSDLVTLMRRMLVFSGAAQVASLAEHMDVQDLPTDSLRRAIRRLLRAGDPKRAEYLLKLYVEARPEDKWGTRKLASVRAELREVSGILSPYQLRRRGFPIPSRKVVPTYEADSSRVLYALHNALPYNSAGYATRTHGILSSLRKSGWDIDGVTRFGYPYDMPGGEEYGDLPAIDVIDGVPYHHLSTTPEVPKKRPLQEYVDKYERRLRWLAKKEKPFVIHGASNHWNGLAAVVAARKLGIPSVYEVRGLWEVTRGSRNPEWAEGGMYKFIAAMERDAAKSADRVITITQALADELVRRGVSPDKITIVPNGVDSDRFRVMPRDQELAEELGLVGKTVIGYIGSLLDYEGIDLLLDAAERLKVKRDDFALLLVGDGAEREELEEDAARRGLTDVVTFTGRVPHEDVESYYSLVDIAPFPRHALPVCEMVSPLKPLEAMAMGKAVLGSNVQAIQEMIDDGKTGLLHEKDNLASLTAQLERLLDDPDLRNELGKNAREWVSSERNWDALTCRIDTLYRELGGAVTGGDVE